jgi:hypothetical protein
MLGWSRGVLHTYTATGNVFAGMLRMLLVASGRRSATSWLDMLPYHSTDFQAAQRHSACCADMDNFCPTLLLRRLEGFHLTASPDSMGSRV